MYALRSTWITLCVMCVGMGWAVSPVAAQKKQRDRISREELMASAQKDQDLFAAVRSLRPHFLTPPRGVRSMGAAPPASVKVYVDGNRTGEVDALKLIMTQNVESVEYLNPSKSQDEFGITASGGAILVTMVKTAPVRPPGY